MVDTCTCEREKRKQLGDRGEQICSIYMIGFHIKSLILKGVHTYTSDITFMLPKT